MGGSTDLGSPRRPASETNVLLQRPDVAAVVGASARGHASRAPSVTEVFRLSGGLRRRGPSRGQKILHDKENYLRKGRAVGEACNLSDDLQSVPRSYRCPTQASEQFQLPVLIVARALKVAYLVVRPAWCEARGGGARNRQGSHQRVSRHQVTLTEQELSIKKTLISAVAEIIEMIQNTVRPNGHGPHALLNRVEIVGVEKLIEGQVSQLTRYSFTVEGFSLGPHMFCLKQIDLDGSTPSIGRFVRCMRGGSACRAERYRSRCPRLQTACTSYGPGGRLPPRRAG